MVHGSLTTPDPAPQTRHGAQRGKRVSRDHQHVLGESKKEGEEKEEKKDFLKSTSDFFSLSLIFFIYK